MCISPELPVHLGQFQLCADWPESDADSGHRSESFYVVVITFRFDKLDFFSATTALIFMKGKSL